ncbi:MAG: branched-chain amino acid ABC transporter permease [Alphaproteobacteria bacterium]|jgi:branched-subunit amino acid ABC-type transport system permease component|nr:MAG: branched-chain amino acid ABC transporter permease [Alphaproteobacteria bacterium]
MTFLGFVFAQGLSALSQAAILFFIASGLTLIFGIMRIVNFAHGAIFMLGAYVGFTAAALTGSFLLSLLLAPIVVGVVGMAFERIFLRPLYGRRDGGAYLLLTFGLAIVLNELIRVIWGPQPLAAGIPDLLRGVVIVLGQPFPLYRLFLIALGVAAAIGVWQFLERTRAGLLIRAVSQNAEMVHALGTDVDLVRTGVFGLGCAMAAVGGVLAAPLVTAFLGMGTTVVIDAFVIVIIGGMGSFLGSLIGSILVGFVQVLGAYYFQDLALAFMYFLMLIVLVIRPGGLLGKED